MSVILRVVMMHSDYWGGEFTQAEFEYMAMIDGNVRGNDGN
jgi:hypothetical protein